MSYAAIYSIRNGIPFTKTGEGEKQLNVMLQSNTAYYLKEDGVLRAYIPYELDYKYKFFQYNIDKNIEVWIPFYMTLVDESVKFNDESVNYYINSDYNYNNAADRVLSIPVTEPRGVITFDIEYEEGYPLNTYACLTYTENGVGGYEIINVILNGDGNVEPTQRVKGDLTGDGKVAMNDVMKLARAVAGTVTLTDEEKEAGDVVKDGNIAMNDVMKLARFVAGTVAEL